MVLMAGERCAAGEGLLAVGERALIRAFAGMNATVSGERTRVTERLDRVIVNRISSKRTKTFTYFTTPLAHMWLLAGVNSHMDGQRRPLNEWFATTRFGANVRPVASVYTYYILLSRWLTLQRSSLPWRARSLLRANPLLQVSQGKVLDPSEAGDGEILALICMSVC